MSSHEQLFGRTVVCLTTHDRVDCARINQEIIKLNYAHPLRIVHACSNEGYVKHLEDVLVTCEPRPLKEGAHNLLRSAIERAILEFAPDFLVHLEADTWLLDELVLARYLAALASDPKLILAASSWSEDAVDLALCTGDARAGHGNFWHRARFAGARLLRAAGFKVGIQNAETYATQFFIMRNRADAVDAVLSMKVERGRSLEASLFAAFRARFSTEHVVSMREREPVEPRNRYWCERLALACQHWPAAGTVDDPRSPADRLYVPTSAPGKRESLLRQSSAWKGEHVNRLLSAEDTDYYNFGAKRY